MENKQMIHIASEIVVLIGLTFYFNVKNKKLMGHIEDLSQRVEEQQDLLQKHEQVIRKLVDFINQQQAQPDPVQKYTSPNYNRDTSPSSASVKPIRVKRSILSERHIKSPLVPPPEPKSAPVRVSFNSDSPQKSVNENLLSSSEDESDLDAELVEELEELHGGTDKEDLDLKKRR